MHRQHRSVQFSRRATEKAFTGWAGRGAAVWGAISHGLEARATASHGLEARATSPARFAWLLAPLLIALVAGTAWSDPAGPTAGDRQIAIAVANKLAKNHLSGHPLDSEISQRCFKQFLKSLDPMKIYFYQSDVDRFAERQNELCREIRRGDISFAYEVFGVFLQRIDEHLQTVEQLLAGPLEFTSDEEMVTDRDLLRYSRTPAEATNRWRQQLKFDILKAKVDKEKKDSQDPQEKLKRHYRSTARKMHQVSADELLELYLNSLTTSLDPHTAYMSPETEENFNMIMRLNLEGIGASLQNDDGYTVVKKIIKGGPAYKDGRLKKNDKVIGVGQGEEGDLTDVIDMKISDVVKLIRGKRGTMVRLEVIPADGRGRQIYAMAREKVDLKDQAAEGAILPVGLRSDGTPYRVGVIKLPSFYRDMEADRRGDSGFRSVTRDVHEILDDFNRHGADAVVLDMRFNGGGALNEAISCSGLFLRGGPVLQVKDAAGHVPPPYEDREPGMVWSKPLVVVINKFSASASEILAGAIQDYHRGLIVGDHSTHGKGTVQSMMDLSQQLFGVPNGPKLGALKMTMQQFYRPDGDSTQRRGVLADIELPSVTSYWEVGEADLPYAMPFDRVPPVRFASFDDVNPLICDQLRQDSRQRVEASPKFQEVAHDIARYQERKAKKSITLNEVKFLKEFVETSGEKEEEKMMEDQDNESGIKRDYYLNELLAITTEYMNLQHLAKLPRLNPATPN